MAFRLLPAAITDIETIATQIAADDPAAARRWINEATRGLIGRPELEALGPDGWLITWPAAASSTSRR